MARITIIATLFGIYTCLCIYVGFLAGVENTQRDAYENGLMTIDRVGDKRIYRWIETHKIGYDYDE